MGKKTRAGKGRGAAGDVERRLMLDDAKKEEMLAVLVRNQRAFEATRGMIDATHVDQIGAAAGLIWRVVSDFHAKFGELPGARQILREVDSRVAATSGEVLDEDDVDLVREFVEYAFDDTEHGRDISRSTIHRRMAIDYAQQFIAECSASRIPSRLIRDGRIVADYPAILASELEAVERARAMGDDEAATLFHEGWDAITRPQMIPTGFATMDRFLGGGWVGGETTVFMGPFGSCKTTTAVMLAANMADHAEAVHLAGEGEGGKRPKVFFFSTEMDASEMRLRLLSYKALVPRKRLRLMRSLDDLSMARKPGESEETAYERDLFPNNPDGDGFIPERLRVEGAAAMLNEYLEFVAAIDANEKYARLGAGGVADFAAWMGRRLARDKGIYPVAFFLDHASALAGKMISRGDMTNDDRRHILRDMVQDVSSKIAKRWNIPAMVMHQLSGEANSRSSTAKIDHSSASECKSFAEYADWAIVSTKPTEDARQLAVFRCTKHRHEPPVSEAVVRVDGKYGRVIDQGADFVVTGFAGIISRAELGTHGANKAGKPRDPATLASLLKHVDG